MKFEASVEFVTVITQGDPLRLHHYRVALFTAVRPDQGDELQEVVVGDRGAHGGVKVELKPLRDRRGIHHPPS